jgi:long-chain acyl-CoA synthetase
LDKFWTKNYIDGIPHSIDIGNDTINDLVSVVFDKYSNNNAFECNGVLFTYQDTQKLVNNLAAAFYYKLGIKKGDRVAVMMPNLVQYPIIIFAILKIGAIVVNINPLYTESEVQYLLENSEAKAIVVLDMMAKKLDNIRSFTKLEHIIVTKVPDLYSFIKRTLINFVIKKIKHVDVSYSYKAHNFRDLVYDEREFNYKPDINNKDLAFIQYTGATTGKPKGAMLTHRNIVANVKQVHAWLHPQCVEGLDKQIVIDALPLYHIFSLTANLFTFFFAGGHNIMVPNPRDVKSLVKTLMKSNFTVFSALDTLYNHLLNSHDFTNHSYPYFKYSVAGGMPSRQSVANKWYEETGVMPSNCYGLTEASPAVTMNCLDNVFDGSVGYPIPNTEVEIRHIETGEILPIGETGIIWFRGPQLMKGYWNNEEQTKKAIDNNGWFNTNDLGYFNNQGKIFINGRMNDMIIVSGFNVYPVEVENTIDSIEYVKESAVFGVVDSYTGEKIVAYIEFKPNCYMTENEIILHLKKKLTSYKVPRHIVIVKEDLPKTLVGKIDKKVLKEKYLGVDANRASV